MSLFIRPFSSHVCLFSALPPLDQISGSLSFTLLEIEALKGTRIHFEIATFIRNVAKHYVTWYRLFGEGSGVDILEGFSPYYTWAHFKWAMACVMTRQNKVPNPDNPSDSNSFNLALIPLYDLVNHESGPITSYFMSPGDTIKLEAKRDFVKGEQLTMSYGPRDCHYMLQFSGFISDNSKDNETAFFDLQLPTPQSDNLHKIRVNLLTSIEIRPEHNSQRYLRSPELMQYVEILQKNRDKLTMEARNEILSNAERLKWSFPFSFIVRSSGVVSHDAASFARVASISDKLDAASALQIAAKSRKTLEEYMVSARKQQEEGLEDDESIEKGMPLLAISEINPKNEAKSKEHLLNALEHAIKEIRTGSDVAAAILASDSPVKKYREMQLDILSRAEMQLKLEDLSAVE
jgi:SET domain